MDLEITNEKISAKDRDLLMAAILGDKDGCTAALRKGANPNACKSDKVTSIHIVAEKGYSEVAEAIIRTSRELGKNLNLDNPTAFGNTPLVLATQFNRLNVLEFLLKAGANPNKTHTFEKTPLHIAAFMGRVQVLLKLIQYNADVNAVDCFHQTPLSLALISKHNVVLVKCLLKAGANPNYRSKTSMPLLSVATLATSRHAELKNIEFLINAGANVRGSNELNGNTALHAAALTGYKPAVDLLVKKGADLFAENAYGETPLNTAIKFRNRIMAAHIYRLEEEYETSELKRLCAEIERTRPLWWTKTNISASKPELENYNDIFT